MNIRSVTAFVDVSYPLEPGLMADTGKILQAVRKAIERAGITVQTTRVAIQSFTKALSAAGPEQAVELAKDLEAMAFVHEIDYISLGPVFLSDPPAYINVIPEILEATESVFIGIEIANTSAGIRLPRTRRTANTIRRISTITEDGFTNLRLAALANVKPWSPFFPAAYHGGGEIRVAIATESADLAVQAIGGASSLEEAQKQLVSSIETEAARIENIVKSTLDRFNSKFQGIDFSLAPYPEKTRSIGTALEKLGIPTVGRTGTLLAAAYLTGALDQAAFTRTGFCGLMLPVLEDTILANSAADEALWVTDLLTFSAVCGTGLDTIPLAGDISPETLTAILLDVGALALRLNKPLTARLMPLPGKEAGDPTNFDFEYFANSRVMAVQDQPLEGLLAGDEDIYIPPLSR